MNKIKELLPVVLIGGGGHASVLADILLSQGREIVAIICPDDISHRKVFSGITQLHHDSEIYQFDPASVKLVNGVGVLPNSQVKKKLNEYFLKFGYQFETVIANSATISYYAEVGIGAQILSGVIIQAGVNIGAHTIVNTGSIIEHDTMIGLYNHIAPSAVICGQVKTGNNVFIGANSTIIQNIKIDNDVVIAAGTVITKDLQAKQTCYSPRPIIK